MFDLTLGMIGNKTESSRSITRRQARCKPFERIAYCNSSWKDCSDFCNATRSDRSERKMDCFQPFFYCGQTINDNQVSGCGPYYREQENKRFSPRVKPKEKQE